MKGWSRSSMKLLNLKEITIKIEDTTSDTMSTEDEFNTDAYSSEDDISSSDSEDKIVGSKKRPMINLLLGRYIVCDELSSACVWGTQFPLYRDHVIRLRHLIKAKKTFIPYYICQLNKTFATPKQRMYFKIDFSKIYLLAHKPQKSNVLPITSEMQVPTCQLGSSRGLTTELQSQQAGKSSSPTHRLCNEASTPSNPRQMDSVLVSTPSKHHIVSNRCS